MRGRFWRVGGWEPIMRRLGIDLRDKLSMGCGDFHETDPKSKTALKFVGLNESETTPRTANTVLRSARDSHG